MRSAIVDCGIIASMPNQKLSGFADEIDPDFDKQI